MNAKGWEPIKNVDRKKGGNIEWDRGSGSDRERGEDKLMRIDSKMKMAILQFDQSFCHDLATLLTLYWRVAWHILESCSCTWLLDRKT